MSGAGFTLRTDVSLQMNDAALRDEIRSSLYELVSRAGGACADEARRLAPVKTGRLRDSIRCTVSVTGDGTVEAAVGTDVPYAAAQELGTSRTAGKHFLENGMAAGAVLLSAGIPGEGHRKEEGNGSDGEYRRGGGEAGWAG